MPVGRSRRRFGRPVRGQKIVGRGEHGLAAQLADAGLLKHILFSPRAGRLALARLGLHAPAAQHRIGVVEARDDVVEALPFFRRQGIQQPPVGRDLLEQAPALRAGPRSSLAVMQARARARAAFA
jgi:hypothetical protein